MVVASSVNKIADDWLVERSQAPLDRVKDWVWDFGAPIVEAVQDRISVATAGKRLLDEGGEAAELGVLAKKVAWDAVAADKDIIDRIAKAVDLYSDAGSLLQNQTGGLGPLAQLASSYTERAAFYKQLLAKAGEPPHEPPMSEVEWDAVKFVQLRQAKAELGLRSQVGGVASGRHGNSFFLCMDDVRRGATNQPMLDDHAQASNNTRLQKIEELMQELFRLQDLKADGLLEEAELIKLNEKIAMLHYGKDVDKNAVRAKFRTLFRSKLDASGRPVAYPKFREYMVQVLNDVDKDPRAQEMILEQFIAEAESARDAFRFQSFASASDFAFMPSTAASPPTRPSKQHSSRDALQTMPEHDLATPSVYDLAPMSIDETGFQNAALLSQSKSGHRIGETVVLEGKEASVAARKLQLRGKLEQEFEQCTSRKQNSKTLARESYARSSSLGKEPVVQMSRSSQVRSDRDLSPRSYANKDAERQASSRRLLQETRRSCTPPRPPPSSQSSSPEKRPVTPPRPPPSTSKQALLEESELRRPSHTFHKSENSSKEAPSAEPELRRPSHGMYSREVPNKGRLLGVVGGEGTLEPRYVS